MSPEIILPVQLNRQTVKFKNAAGEEVSGFESIHHQNETLFGIGDIELAARLVVVEGSESSPFSASTRLGFTLPTGGTEEDPFELGRQGKKHQHMFFGAGTFDPLLGVDVAYQFTSLTLVGWSSARLNLYQNPKGYRGSTRISTGVGGESGLGREAFRFRLQAEVYHETAAKWSGETAENSGRTDLIPAVGMNWLMSPNTSLGALLKFPQTVHSEGGQMKQYVVGFLVVSHTLDVFDSASAEF